jgi:hypothetical protein
MLILLNLVYLFVFEFEFRTYNLEMIKIEKILRNCREDSIFFFVSEVKFLNCEKSQLNRLIWSQIAVMATLMVTWCYKI